MLTILVNFTSKTNKRRYPAIGAALSITCIYRLRTLTLGKRLTIKASQLEGDGIDPFLYLGR